MIINKKDRPASERVNMRGGKGAVAFLDVADQLPKNLRVCSALTVPPGASIGYHVHENESEIYIILSGAGEVQDHSEQWSPVAQGDCMITPSGCGHAVRNTCEVPLELIAIIALD